MSKHYFSKIDKQNFVSNPRSEGVAVDSTANQSDKGVEQNLLTHPGSATLADFVVALAQNRVYTFAHAPRNQAQGRSFQLVKNSV